jgi:hypothetical protein
MQQPVDVFEEARQIEKLMKMGYTWFDMMYPRGSDAEARELKIGKYADPKMNEPICNKYRESLLQNNSDKLSGKKRHRKN